MRIQSLAAALTSLVLLGGVAPRQAATTPPGAPIRALPQGSMVPLSTIPTTTGSSTSAGPAPAVPAGTTPATPAAPTDLPSLIAAIRPSILGVVAITHDYTGGIAQVSSGSGVVVGPGGIVVTNHHVIAGADQLEVVTDTRQVLTVDPRAVWDDPLSDLAFLRTGDGNLPPAPLARSADVVVGEAVFTIGDPLGAELADTVTRGIVSGLGRWSTDSLYPFLQTDAAINPGNSGGALVDLRGEVVGITSEKIAGSELQGLGFAKPADLVAQTLASFQRYGYVVRPYLGVNLAPDPWQVQYGLPVSGGPVVTAVQAGSPAAQAGIAPGDAILTVAGQPVHSQADLQAAINAAPVGAKLAYGLLRAGRPLQVQVVLTQRPQGD